MSKKTKTPPVFKIRATYEVTNHDERRLRVVVDAGGYDRSMLHGSAWHAVLTDLRNFGIDPEKCIVEPIGSEYFVKTDKDEPVFAEWFCEGAERDKAIKQRVYLPEDHREAAEIYG